MLRCEIIIIYCENQMESVITLCEKDGDILVLNPGVALLPDELQTISCVMP
jgi:hypothetical protein